MGPLVFRQCGPDWNPRLSICGLSLLLVLVSALRIFLQVWGFSSTKNPALPNSNLIRNLMAAINNNVGVLSVTLVAQRRIRSFLTCFAAPWRPLVCRVIRITDNNFTARRSEYLSAHTQPNASTHSDDTHDC